MGCCVAREGLTKDKTTVFADLDKNLGSYFSNINSSNADKEKSQEFARGFFRQSTKNVLTSSNDNSHKIFNGNNNKNDRRNKNEICDEEEISKEIQETIEFPRLELQITNQENAYDESQSIVITPNTINGVKKNFGDRFFFGSRSSSSENLPFNSDSSNSLKNSQFFISESESTNDYYFDDPSMASRQFEISYNSEKSKYYILENKQGTGTFLKIRQKLPVNRDMIISFCSCHIVLQVFPDEKLPLNKIIIIKFLIGGKTTQEKVFNSKEKTKITIGRSKKADVVCNDESVSRTQCTLIYENNSWNLYDGFLDNGHRGSTNGLWLLASCKLELKNEAIIKSGNVTMNVKIKHNKNESSE